MVCPLGLECLEEECPNQHYCNKGFAPAVSLDNWRTNWQVTRAKLRHMAGVPSPEPKFDSWGFYQANGVPGLAWKWQEDEEISSAD